MVRKNNETALFAAELMNKYYNPVSAQWRYGVNYERVNADLKAAGMDCFEAYKSVYLDKSRELRRWKTAAFMEMGLLVMTGGASKKQIKSYWKCVLLAAEEDTEEFNNGVGAISESLYGPALLIGFANDLLDGYAARPSSQLAYSICYLVSSALKGLKKGEVDGLFVNKFEEAFYSDEKYCFLIPKLKDLL